MGKFFFGAAVGGRLRLRDIPDWGYWNSTSIAYWDEAHIDGVVRLASAGRKIWSAVELDDAIATSFDLPGIQTLWIHESLLAEARVRWQEARRAVRNRLETRAPAAAVLVLAMACAGGLAATAYTPTQSAHVARAPLMVGDAEAVRWLRAPRTAVQAYLREAPSQASRSDAAGRAPVMAVSRAPRPARVPATVLPVRARAGAAPFMPRAGAPPMSRNAHALRRPGGTAAYAVSAGRFVSAAQADHMKHDAGRKGYVMIVVPRGAMSEVTTRPYRTREQAERTARGLKAAGVPAQLVAWRLLTSGRHTATY